MRKKIYIQYDPYVCITYGYLRMYATSSTRRYWEVSPDRSSLKIQRGSDDESWDSQAVVTKKHDSYGNHNENHIFLVWKTNLTMENSFF